MDRIDIHIWINPVKASSLVRRSRSESSREIAERVMKARSIQHERFMEDGIFTNSAMGNKQIEKYCRLSPVCRDFLEKTIDRTGLSARACTRILKLARTIADMEGVHEIGLAHLSEAIGYRFLDKPDIMLL